ncbi:MAG: membrane protein insertase YidC [Candidatus Cloacimonetes bacterium]|nr:membrane protein insertase YidC [Candidatus Cloacimonadota bacterium]
MSTVSFGEILFSKSETGFTYSDEDRKISFDSLGNISSYQMISSKYTKNFMDASHKVSETKKSIAAQELGIRFGFLNRDESIFQLVDHKVVSNDPYKVEFQTKDVGEASPAKGLIVTKTYTMLPGYQIDVVYDLFNSNKTPITSLYASSKKGKVPGIAFGITVALDSWAYYSVGSKADLESLSAEPESQTHADTAWSFLAYQSSHHVLALHKSFNSELWYKKLDLEYKDGMPYSLYSGFLPLEEENIKAGQNIVKKMSFFLGEKREEVMAETKFSPLFNRYGKWLGWIERPMMTVLKFFHDQTHSWGWAIILLTILAKLCLVPLNLKQTRTMAKMQELQPKLKQIQERYADDKQRLQQEMMKLYQTYNVNPLSGCLPMFLQIPIFFALYSTVSGSVEIVGEPFLWMGDLSLKDPSYMLVIFFLGSFVLSQRKMSIDPNQKMIMYLMPVFMVVVMKDLPAGVMLYIAGQSLLSNVEQMIVKKPSTQGAEENVEVIAPQNTEKKKKKKKNK